ncbi:hypothetical protein [Prosthecobacter sp.]|uniref:hypothetical protein n=1 Tax=Prosthecobacter sp. TaxID=1965333 RepID=UPI003784428F
MTIHTITYQPRWKEMFDGHVGKNRFTVEMTMGRGHVYFPTENTWNHCAPFWAEGLWQQAKEGAEAWCLSNSVAFHVEETAWVEFHPSFKLPSELKA